MRSNENIIVHHHFLGLHLGMETPQYFFGVNAGRFMVFLPSVDAQEGNVSATPNVSMGWLAGFIAYAEFV